MTVASLPMYDWPEVRPAVDRIWTLIGNQLQARGIDAPEQLDRSRPEYETWTDPELILGHTCGLPLMTSLRDRVEVIGTFAMELPDTPDGRYHSALVVRADDSRTTLPEFAQSRAAVNSRDSQSGHNAFVTAVSPHATDGHFFAAVNETGSHRESMRAVAAGECDIACIDAMSFRLGQRHEPAVAGLRVLDRTASRPGTPLITSPANREQRPALIASIEAALAAAEPSDRDATGFHRFVPAEEADYLELLQAQEQATLAGYPELA